MAICGAFSSIGSDCRAKGDGLASDHSRGELQGSFRDTGVLSSVTQETSDTSKLPER